MSARPYRLLAMVKQDAVVRVQKEPDDTVMTWPHLVSIEFMAAAVMLFTMICCLGLILTFVGIFFRGPGYAFVIPSLFPLQFHFAL